MAKILVTPINKNFPPKLFEGKLTRKHFTSDGWIYYIEGQSFPGEIVTVLEGEVEDI